MIVSFPSLQDLTIISSPQIGADRGALKAARKCGVKTLGFAPQNFKTDDHYPSEKLIHKYNIQECSEKGFRAKDEMNAKQSDGLIAFRLNKPLTGKGTEQVSFFFLHNERAPPDLTIPLKETVNDLEIKHGKKPVLVVFFAMLNFKIVWDVQDLIQNPDKLISTTTKIIEFIGQFQLKKIMIAGPVDGKAENGQFDYTITDAVKTLFIQVFKQISFHIPLFGITHPQYLHNRFQRIGKIGGGGEALVFSVLDRLDSKKYALRIRAQMTAKPKIDKPLYLKLIEHQKQNLHLIHIFNVFLLENKNYPFSGGKKKGSFPFENLASHQFIRSDFSEDPEAIPYYHEVTVMELGGKDLASDEFKQNEGDSFVTEIQCSFSTYLLSLDNIKSFDKKPRNFVTKLVDEEELNGIPLKTYCYWHYHIGKYHFYLPKPHFLIKRIDFGGWMLSKEPLLNEKDTFLENLLERKSLKIEDITTKYSKPDICESKILNVSLL